MLGIHSRHRAPGFQGQPIFDDLYPANTEMQLRKIASPVNDDTQRPAPSHFPVHVAFQRAYPSKQVTLMLQVV